jgi:hypothetical protein
MKRISIALLILGLTACSGGEPAGPSGRSGSAAAACDAFVKNKLDGKQYTLDMNVLAASMKDGGAGTSNLSAPIIIEPGLTTEVKQTVQCDIRFGADDAPEVTNATFIW